MAGYDVVLLPTDGSAAAQSAAEAGLGLAGRYGATAHALFVVDERRVLDEFDLAVEAAEGEAERALEAVEREGVKRDVPVEIHLRRGVPHREILDAIDAYRADLVVLGCRGRSGLERLVQLGSVTERVVRRSPVQVLCVPEGAEPDG